MLHVVLCAVIQLVFVVHSFCMSFTVISFVHSTSSMWFFNLPFYFHGSFICLHTIVFICPEGHGIPFLLPLSNDGGIVNVS